jgi:Methyltransferase domain/Domain of unknown function (DUF4440)
MNLSRPLLVVVLGACASAARPVPTSAPPDEAMIRQKSHDVLLAFDRGDVAAVKAMLGDNYVHFEGAVTDREHELVALAARPADEPQILDRTWSDERVFTRATDAVFIGRAHEHQGGNEKHGGYEFDGWYTLAWSRAGGDWELVLWTWRIAGAASQAANWNQIYLHGTGFEHAPNHLLVQSTQPVKPGTALDVAMGQGRNSLYLASQGWKVTGIDIADEGLREAREAATAKGLTIDTINADVATFDYGLDRYDLVAMIYAPSGLKRIPDLQRATKPGGLFVYEYFAPTKSGDNAPAPGALAAQFTDGWEILGDTIVEDTPDWAIDRAKLQRFVARKK